MALNLEAIFRITAKVRDEGIARLASGLERADRAAMGAKKSFKGVVDSAAWQGAAVAAGGLLLALGSGVRAAIEFESAVADVRKVLSGLESPQGLKEVRSEIIGLSREMPIAASGFAAIYAAAGQSGIARDEVRAFAIDVAKMAVAFDMTADEAGEAMAKMRTALGLSQPEVLELADALNYLSNNTASTGAELVNFVKRSGAVGKMAGLTAEQTAAFGATMIGAGIEVEVAATSFNNMIKALGRGSSATARQERAFKALGFAAETVADGEKRMTEAVQRQSDRRVEIIQGESDRQMRELRRRYRQMTQLQEDQWEDESDAQEDAIRDQSDAQIEALQKQADARIKAIEKQYGDNQEAADAQTQLIRDQLDDEVEAIRDATDRQSKLQQRANRDKQQSIRDALDDQMDSEISAIERIAKERERVEKEATAKTIEQIKAASETGGSQIGRDLAKRLQEDALGTIRDVLSRLKNLPDDQRISVLSDLFGDEARGLAPMVGNLAALEQALLLVADKTKYAGSMTKEYQVRSETTANALQLAKNNFDALAITVGGGLVPALTKFLQVLEPVISGVLKFAEANPVLTTVAASVAAVVSAFVLAAPFILATVKLFALVGPAFAGAGAAAAGFAATVAGWAGIIAPILAALKAAVVAVAAFATGIAAAPILVGLAIGAAVVAVVGGIILFRKEIGAFFSWLGQAVAAGWRQVVTAANQFFIQPLINVWEQIKPPILELWNWIRGAFVTGFTAALAIGDQLFVAPWVNLWDSLRQPVAAAWQWIARTFSEMWGALLSLAYDLFVKPWVTLWTEVVVPPVVKTVEFVQKAWGSVSQWFAANVTTPIARVWSQLTTTLQTAWQRVVTFIPNAVQTAANRVRSIVSGMMNVVARGLNSIIAAINRVIESFNKVAAATKSPFRISYLNQVSVPAFAEGGYLTRPTLGLLREKGENEYVVPEGKAAGFAQNIIAGTRGAAAIPSGRGSSSGGGIPAKVELSLTTGPIMQDQSGQQWMTIQDGERLARQTAEQVLRALRTPGGRYMTGAR
jgi:TP901 family phage tail tape measure protein